MIVYVTNNKEPETEPRESRASKLDERFLRGANFKPERRKLPFFGNLHQEISRSWKQPFSSRLTNAAAADFTNLVGSVEQGYTAMPVVEDTLASHLSPSLAPYIYIYIYMLLCCVTFI